MHRLSCIVGVCLVSFLASSPVPAGDWPGWRGEDGNGVSSDTGLPSEWSAEKNVVWSIDLPQWGNSSPCIVGDRIYITSQTEDTSLHVIAIDREKGEIVWKRSVGQGTKNHHKLHNMASPTCVAEKDRVWALFGTGDLFCLDRAGETQWKRNLEKDHGDYKILWGMASSPRLHGDRLFIACMTGGPSYVLALDKKTGDALWKTERKLPCVGEAVDSYSSPILFRAGKSVELVVAGADHVSGYDLVTGKQRWISSGLSIPHDYGRTIASPTARDGMVFAASSGYGGLGRVLALRMTDEVAGDVTKTHRAWTYKKHAPDCPSPLFYRGLVYVVRDNGVASCLDGRSGAVRWRERLFRGDCKASPVAGDGKVYFTSVKGEVTVLKAGPERQVLATNRIPGRVIATPALSDGVVYVRARDKLWAFGKKR
jgi:outer membrane protein assembly factor BamB